MKKEEKIIYICILIYIFFNIYSVSAYFDSNYIPDQKNHGYIIQLKNPSLIEKNIELNELAIKNEKEISEMSNFNPLKYWRILFDLKQKDIPKKLNEYKTKIESNKELVKNKIKDKLKKDLVINDEFKDVINVIVLNVSESEIKKLEDIPEIKKISPNLEIRADLMDSISIIKANYSWSLNYKGEGIKIAILDTGIDYTHPDLGNCTNLEFLSKTCSKVVDGYDFVNKDNDPIDDHGHGTHCAGIAAGTGKGGLKGVAPEAKLYAYKVLNSAGTGTFASVIAGIERAVDPNNDGDYSDHVDIMSLSLGINCGGIYTSSCGPDDLTSTAVDNAVKKGVVAVISAGNSGPGLSTIGSPGTSRKAITVGAAYKTKTMASFSSRGPVIYLGEYISKPDVVAPGVLICSAQYDSMWNSSKCFDEKHIAISGTSMAAPHVAGMAALIKQKFTSYTPEKIKELIKNTSDFISGYTINDEGSGLINIQKAMNINDLSLPLSKRLPLDFLNEVILSKNILDEDYALVQNNKTLYIVWKENSSLYFTQILTNGNLSIYKKKLTKNNIYNEKNPDILFANNISHIVWSDDRDNNKEIYYIQNIEKSSDESEIRITFSGIESIKPRLIDLKDSLGLLFLKKSKDSYDLIYKKLDYNKNILIEDRLITDAQNFDATYFNDSIYIVAQDVFNNIRLINIDKNGNLINQNNIAIGKKPLIRKYNSYDNLISYIDNQDNLHILIFNELNSLILSEQVINSIIDNPVIEVDEEKNIFIYYQRLNFTNQIYYSVLSNNFSFLVKDKIVTSPFNNSYYPKITIGNLSLNLLYKLENSLYLLSTDSRINIYPEIISEKLENIGPYSAIIRYNFKNVLRYAKLIIKLSISEYGNGYYNIAKTTGFQIYSPDSGSIVAILDNDTITDSPSFSIFNLTPGTKYDLELIVTDLSGNSKSYSSELNISSFYTRTTSKIPELPTNFYGKVITTDNKLVEGILVSAKWIDIDDNEYISNTFTLTTEQAKKLGNPELAGYFIFNDDSIKAKKGSKITVSSPEDLNEPDPYVIANPGKKAIEINTPILMSGELPIISIISPLEKIYLSNETPNLVYNVSKKTNFVTFSLNNGSYINITNLDNNEIKISPKVGLNHITINVTDITNLKNSKTIAFIINDITPPNLTLDNPFYEENKIKLSASVVDLNSPLNKSCLVCISSDGICDTKWTSANNEFKDGDFGGKCSYIINKSMYNEGIYYFNFKVSDSYNNFGVGLTKSFIIDKTPPQEISSLIINTDQTKNSLKLYWSYSKDPDFKEYRIYRSNSPEVKISTISNRYINSFIDNDVIEKTTYKYRITVVDNYENENLGISSSATVPDITAPIIRVFSPENMKSYNQTIIPLKFTVSEPSNCSYILNGVINTISEKILASEGENYIFIKCIDNSSNVGISSNTSFNVDTIIPPPVYDVKINQIENRLVFFINWNASEDAKNFHIYRSNKEFTEISQADKQIISPSKFFYDSNDLIPNNTYYYAILPEDSAGNINYNFTLYSQKVNPLIQIEPINNLQVISIANEPSLLLKWEKSNNSKFLKYNIYRSNESFSSVKSYESTNKTIKISEIFDKNQDFFIDSNLPLGKTYYYAVTQSDIYNNENTNVISVFGTVYINETLIPIITGLRAVQSPFDLSVNLSWDNITTSNFSNYNVYRNNYFFNKTDKMTPIAKITNNFYKDNSLQYPGIYYYGITITDNNLNERKEVIPININITEKDFITPNVSVYEVLNPIFGIITISAFVSDNIGLKKSCLVCISSDGICDTEWTSANNEFSIGSKSGVCSFIWNTAQFEKNNYTINFRVSDLSDNQGTGIEKITRVIDPPSLYCSDGTTYNFCSINKPKYCMNGFLIDKCNLCGCNSDSSCNLNGSCVINKCIDQTNENNCSINKPKYCVNQTLVNKCTKCGCIDGYFCNITSENCEYEISFNQTCSDKTPYGTCSSNQPQFCNNGTLIDNCVKCGCKTNYICNIQTGICEFQNPPVSSINLYTGWNLIALPIKPIDNSISKVLLPIKGKYDSVYSYDPVSKKWLVYKENTTLFGESNTLTTIDIGRAYWIDMKDNAILPINGTPLSSYSENLLQGWNFIGYPYNQEKFVFDTLSSLKNKYDIIFTFDNQNKKWSFYSPYESIYENSFNKLEPGKGYWIYLYEPTKWEL
ncbi:MAG: S8 family serine peptidase [Candidatus Pacearchaeota archaeon]